MATQSVNQDKPISDADDDGDDHDHYDESMISTHSKCESHSSHHSEHYAEQQLQHAQDRDHQTKDENNNNDNNNNNNNDYENNNNNSKNDSNSNNDRMEMASFSPPANDRERTTSIKIASIKRYLSSWLFPSRKHTRSRGRRRPYSDSRSVKSHKSDATTSRDEERNYGGNNNNNDTGGGVGDSSQQQQHALLCCNYYINLLRENRNFRLYLVSHLCQHAGDWFVHVAGLIAIEQLVPDSGTAISILVAMRMIPMIFFTSIGGALADHYDRRKLMIALDSWNAFIAIFYIIALHYQSPTLFYTVAFLRHTVVAIYEPITRSIVPLLVKSDEDLKCAMTLNGMAWAVTLAVGGTLAGWTAGRFGVGSCYIVDSMTYLISMVVMWMVKGKFCVREETRHVGASTSALSFLSSLEESVCQKFRRYSCLVTSPVVSFVRMFVEMMSHLMICKYGLLVLLKATGQLTWGSADIINVHYSHVDGDEVATSSHIGFIYSSIGIGCLLGPICANFFTDMDRPASLQVVCVTALGIVAFGWVGMSVSETIEWLCLFNSIRAFGSAVIWINSTLLLQKLTPSTMLGRILSFDFALTMFLDTIASFVTGIHIDADVSVHDVAFGLTILTGILWVFWSLYHAARLGAARKSFNTVKMVSPSVSLHKDSGMKHTNVNAEKNLISGAELT